MKKWIIILIGLLVLSGCSTDSFSFKYKDKVIVTSGFYEGQVGIIFGNSCGVFSDKFYNVIFDNRILIGECIHESHLEKAK